MKDLRIVGKTVPRIDAREKISGAAQYTDDLDYGKNLLYAHLVESTEAHARIISIDTSEAEKVPGVHAVFTGKDFPYKFGLYMKDRFIFAQDRVRFVGEQIAAVVSRCPKTARKAAELVKVEYEPLPKILDPLKAMEADSPLVHPEMAEYPHVPWFFPEDDTNIPHRRRVRKGDMEKGFEEADIVLEESYEVPRYVHCAIENHAAVGRYDQSGRLTIWASSQSPHTQRHIFAEALAPLGFRHIDVRVIAPHVGGGFGCKAGVTMEILAAAMATKLQGYTVKVVWSREQEFRNTYQRLGANTTIKMGVKKDGTITALEHNIYWDAGAYVEYGANVVNAVGLSATGPYRIDNVSIDSVCIYTTLPPGGAYRGFGYSEFLFGLESHINRIADKLGIDPFEIRRKNAIKAGDVLAYGAKSAYMTKEGNSALMNPNGLMEAIDRVEKEIEWGKKMESSDPTKAIGKGMALLWKAPAMPANPGSSAFLKFNEDASLNILVSGMDIGQGFLTVMAQIASEILSVPVDKIRTENPDTDRNPYEWQTVASHITWGCGNAVRKAAISARKQIFEIVSRTLHLPEDELYLEDEQVKCHTKPTFSLPLKDFVVGGLEAADGTFKGGPILGKGTFLPEYINAYTEPATSQGGHPNVHYTVGAAGIILEVDRETGKMKILKVAQAIDAGKAINPGLVEGQITGGVLQGLATVMFEDIRYDENGKLLNPNFTDYKIPTAKDIPEEIVPIIVEVPQPDGPFGARGVGEQTMLAAAPMVANAIYDALGVRINSMPVTAEKIALAMQAKNSK